jgi:glycosyltransferase involved in cell wall biosynthesis
MRHRLLVVASTFPAQDGDGTPGFVRDLAMQEARDFDVLVIVPRVRGGALRETSESLTIIRYPYWFRRFEDLADGAIIENLRTRRTRYLQVIPFFFAQYRAVRRAIREFQPDVVHVHWIIPQGIVVRLAARKLPKIVTTLGGDLYALNAAPLRALKRWVIVNASAITVMNADMATRVEALGADPETVTVLPMGADLTTLSAALARASVRRDDGPLAVLFVGRLVEKKGVAVLLEALRAVSDSVGFELVVVGDGPLRTALTAAAQGLPVRFVGQLGRTDLARQYAAANVAMFPSVAAASGDQDGLPVALLEAMGASCAVVASDLPGINEAVRDGHNGLLVPPGDAGALAAAITRLADDPSLRATLGVKARATALSYSTDAVGERYRALLHRIMRDDSGPTR